MPDTATVDKIYDHLDFIRGVEVFLNFIPLTSVEGIRMGMEELGCTHSNQCLIFDRLMDSNPLFLTGNTDTVYASIMLDLKQDGPTVVEIPPECGPSTVNDAFFRFVTDMGMPGPDRGAGGKYLLLPPDYEGELSVSKDQKWGQSIKRKDEFIWVAEGCARSATHPYFERFKIVITLA